MPTAPSEWDSGVEEQFRLAARGAGLPPIAVAAHAVGDPAGAAGVGAEPQENLPGHGRARRGVTGGARVRVLPGAADVVQQRREGEHPRVRAALLAEPQRQSEHPLDVVEAVTAAPRGHQPPRFATRGAHERVAAHGVRKGLGGALHISVPVEL